MDKKGLNVLIDVLAVFFRRDFSKSILAFVGPSFQIFFNLFPKGVQLGVGDGILPDRILPVNVDGGEWDL